MSEYLQILKDRMFEKLSGEIRESSIKIIDYLSVNNLTVEPAAEGPDNFQVPYNGKNLCKIWLIDPDKIEYHFWYGDYCGDFDEDFKTAVQENVWYCWTCHEGCISGKDTSIFGKELKNVCSQHTIVFVNPNDEQLEYVKVMIEYAKKIVPDCISYHANY